MADVSNLKIPSRLKRRAYESLKQEIKFEKIDLYQRGNMKIGKIASSAKY